MLRQGHLNGPVEFPHENLQPPGRSLVVDHLERHLPLGVQEKEGEVPRAVVASYCVNTIRSNPDVLKTRETLKPHHDVVGPLPGFELDDPSAHAERMCHDEDGPVFLLHGDKFEFSLYQLLELV